MGRSTTRSRELLRGIPSGRRCRSKMRLAERHASPRSRHSTAAISLPCGRATYPRSGPSRSRGATRAPWTSLGRSRTGCRRLSVRHWRTPWSKWRTSCSARQAPRRHGTREDEDVQLPVPSDPLRRLVRLRDAAAAVRGLDGRCRTFQDQWEPPRSSSTRPSMESTTPTPTKGRNSESTGSTHRPGSRRVGRTGPSARCSRDLEETAGQRRSEGIMRPDPARQGRTVRRNASAPSTTQAGIIAWVQPDVRAIQTCR